MTRFLTSSALRTVVLAVGVSLFLLVGCDFTSQSSSSSSQSSSSFEVTNDLGDRITLLSGKARSDAGPAGKKDFRVKGVLRVEPPTINGEKASVSYLSSDTNHVFVGYKIAGKEFGGGIDIFDASDPTALGDNKITSVESQSVDVQEVVDKDTKNDPSDVPPLYVAGSKLPPGPLVETNAVAMRLVTSLSGVDVKTVRLSGNVAKSVAEAPRDDPRHDFYIATDDSTVYRFNEDLEDRFEQAVEFREWSSVTATQNGLFALSKSGNIWTAGYSSPSPLTEKISMDGSGINPGGIARIQSARAADGCPYVLAALNTGGFRMLSGDASTELFTRASGNYTSATMMGGMFLYASKGNGEVEVFEFNPNDDNNPIKSDPIRTIDTSKFPSDFAGPEQVNQVIRAGDYLYVANSTGGVLVLEVTSPSSTGSSSSTGGTGGAKAQC